MGRTKPNKGYITWKKRKNTDKSIRFYYYKVWTKREKGTNYPMQKTFRCLGRAFMKDVHDPEAAVQRLNLTPTNAVLLRHFLSKRQELGKSRETNIMAFLDKPFEL